MSYASPQLVRGQAPSRRLSTCRRLRSARTPESAAHPTEEEREWGEQTLKQHAPGVPGSAICVQRFDDSLNSAIRITYRISLRSSSLREPRHPLLKVVYWFVMAGPLDESSQSVFVRYIVYG